MRTTTTTLQILPPPSLQRIQAILILLLLLGVNSDLNQVIAFSSTPSTAFLHNFQPYSTTTYSNNNHFIVQSTKTPPTLSFATSAFTNIHKNRKYTTTLYQAQSSSSSFYTPDTSPQTIQFQKWLFTTLQCDGSDSTQLGYNIQTKQRGLYATQDHKQGDVLLSIPFDSALVMEEEETSDVERGYKFLKLCREKILQDTHQAYLNMLPTLESHFDPTPDFWTMEEVEALEFPRMVKNVLEKKKRLQSFFDSLPESEKKGIAMEELQFATWLVESRSFSILKEPAKEEEEEDVDDDDDEENFNIEDIETMCVLIPYIDMINHSSLSPNAEIDIFASSEGDDEEDVEVKYYAVVAKEDIKVGEEILISYGTGEDTTVDLLYNYGFVVLEEDVDEEHGGVNPFDVEMYDYCEEDEEENDCFMKEEEWTTTLEEDEARLKDLSSSANELNTREEMALSFRIKLKRALREWKSYDDDDEYYESF